jgi:hypothetical protein
MTDLITRLRSDIDGVPASFDETDAANEIEGLRAEVAWLRHDAVELNAARERANAVATRLECEAERLNARLHVAVEALQRIKDWTPDEAMGCPSIARETLARIGPLPGEEP